MSSTAFESIYKNVPQAQREQLLNFRTTHPVKKLAVAGTDWEYLAGGNSEETLLFITGGDGDGESWFRHMLIFENEYHTISPWYPLVTTMREMVEGIAAILDAEGVRQAHIVGASLGGMVAQSLVRTYPDRVKTITLANTAAPAAHYAQRLKSRLKLFPFFPLWLYRFMVQQGLTRAMTTPDNEREFWRAFQNEFLPWYTRERGANEYKLIIDFAENYTPTYTPADLQNWPGKILILESDNDQLIEASLRESLKALYPQAQVHTFHGAGHVSAFSRREEFIAIMRNFMHESALANMS